MGCGRHTFTPPTTSVRAAKPLKSTTTVWSTRRPVSFSTVFCVQAGFPPAVSPVEYAALNIVSGRVLVQLPSGSLQGGIVTRVSRGTDTATALRWSA